MYTIVGCCRRIRQSVALQGYGFLAPAILYPCGAIGDTAVLETVPKGVQVRILSGVPGRMGERLKPGRC